MHILLVEDDDLVASGVASALEAEGFTLDRFPDARRADAALRAAHTDAVVLDLGLPDTDGMKLLRDWRASDITVPVLILTARDDVDARIAGLEAGADDYVLKPFDLGELTARLQALIRRAAGRPVPELTHGRLRYRPAEQTVTLDGEPVSLSRRELALLEALLYSRGAILSEEQLKDSLYGLDTDIGSNALNVHIHHLRRKLGRNLIDTVRGVGYRLGPTDEREDA